MVLTPDVFQITYNGSSLQQRNAFHVKEQCFSSYIFATWKWNLWYFKLWLFDLTRTEFNEFELPSAGSNSTNWFKVNEFESAIQIWTGGAVGSSNSLKEFSRCHKI